MKVIAIKKENGMTAIMYPCPDARGIVLIPGKDAIPAVPAFKEVKQSKTTPYQPARAAIPAIPAVPPQVLGGDGVAIPGLTKLETEEDFLARVASSIPKGKEFMIVDSEDLPNSDEDFFEAWKYGKAITIDLAAARDVQRNRLRVLRAPALAALDVAYMQADEKGDIESKSSIAKQKQALRDLTNCRAISTATTMIQLRNAGLDILQANSL